MILNPSFRSARMEDESAQMVVCIPRLRRYARTLVGNRAAADDLVQDTMERGWNRLDSWRHAGMAILNHAQPVRRFCAQAGDSDREFR